MAADSLEKLTRTVKRYYEEIRGLSEAGKIGIDQFLFGIDDRDLSAQFTLDQYIKEPHGVSFRRPGEQSHVRAFENGVGKVIEVPRISEKTPITEAEKDMIVVGLESTASQAEHAASRVNKIINIHRSAHMQTRWKYAIDVMRTGKFSPLGETGKDIGLEIDYGRAAANTATYNFTSGTNDQDGALKAMYDLYRAKGGPLGNICVIMGSTWAADFQEDATVIKWIQANTANQLLAQQMKPAIFNNVQGLYNFATYRPKGCMDNMYLCTFDPGHQFTPYKGASSVPFVPAEEAIMFSVDSPRYRVFRGVDVISDARMVERVVGEMVFDSFVDNDPITEYIRSQSRVAFVPANVDHTVKCLGTFS